MRQHVRRWAVVLIVAIVAIVAVLAVLGQSDDERRSRRLAATAGLTVALDVPLHEIWRLTTDVPEAGVSAGVARWGPGYAARDSLVEVAVQTDGGSIATGIDPRTGSRLWVAPLSGPGVSTVMPSCVVPPPGDVAACSAFGSVTAPTTTLTGSAVDSVRMTRLVLLDTATGRVLRERALAASTAVAAVGPDVVTAQVEGDTVVTARIDLRTGNDRWSVTNRLTAGPYVVDVQVSVTVDATVLVVRTATQTWEISADGVPLAEQRLAAMTGAHDVQILAQGRAILWTPRLSRGESTGTVLDVTGGAASVTGRTLVIDGYPLRPTVDDGTMPDLVISGTFSQDRIIGWDLHADDSRWSRSLTEQGDPALIDGRVVIGTTDGLHVLDPRTGADLWRTTSPSPSDRGFVTDGTAVAVLEANAGFPHRRLSTYGLADGQRWWSVDVDDAIDQVVQYGGRLYGRTSRGVVAFG